MKYPYQNIFKSANKFFVYVHCHIALFCILLLFLTGCKKFVEADAPKGQLIGQSVFSTDGSANSAIANLYRSFRDYDNTLYNTTIITGLAGDELYNFFPDMNYDQYYNNDVQSTNTNLPWAKLYNIIYQCNAIVEGLQSNTNIPATNRNQYIGEAKFIRALSYFYLVNFFENVPLVLSTDPSLSANAGQAESSTVYEQIVKDLTDARDEMVTDYSFGNGDRIRANKWCAKALLSRVYLYMNQWDKAEAEATDVINSGNYDLISDLNSVFQKNNNEAILQWANGVADGGSTEPRQFVFTDQPHILCTENLLSAFEAGDMRRQNWIRMNEYQGVNYYYPYKYKVTSGTTNEYYTVLRLAEQYLIRAEARSQQNEVKGAIEDLNRIRKRAELSDIPPTITKDSCLKAVYHERRVELFAELGHRWFDMKRTGLINDILSSEKPEFWKPYAALFPIPLTDIQKDQNLNQNPGY